ncbi:ankyrin repeat domain-containing protein [Cardinium endosymbiont of Tipula unca]|uniref:ankyrin repeat domain-containing protein n=1 Tax=Cardinium endosymbiont of Tipula unca TaxID=3066216 RepID=UPI0030D1E250
MLFCSIKGANRGYIQVLLATSRNRIYFRRRSNGHTEVVKLLLTVSGIMVNEKDKNRVTPLHYAAAEGHTEVVSRS